jgi:hypothetical protein
MRGWVEPIVEKKETGWIAVEENWEDLRERDRRGSGIQEMEQMWFDRKESILLE